MKHTHLRIIGGELRGKKLHPIKGQNIRPTANRVREALFSILAFQLAGKIVLDLFAGTGALGIEALSRGAAFAYFIDNHPEAIRVIRQNLQACGLLQRSRVIQWDIGANVDCLQGLLPHPGLALMDPPYNRGLVGQTLANLYQGNVLDQQAQVAVEHSPNEPIPDQMPMFVLTDQRTYGKTLVSFLKYMV